MKHLSCLAALLALLTPGAGSAADLTRIDRTIVKQPVDLKAPTYCLLVFGPEAKAQRWLILDGNDLYVDLNGNGDLTEAGEKRPLSFIDLGPLPDADGSELNARLRVERFPFGMRLTVEMGNRCKQFIGFDPSDRLAFASRPEDAPIVHIGGPLTFRWFVKPPELVAGQRCRFFTSLGTPGLGKGSFAAVQCCHVPDSARLTALIDYPHRDLEQPPIQVKQSLAADWTFYFKDFVQVPANVGRGTVRVTLTAQSWQGRPIVPVRLELPMK